MPLGGWQPSLVALFAIVDVSGALNAAAVSMRVPPGTAAQLHAKVALFEMLSVRVCVEGMLCLCLINFLLFSSGLRRFFTTFRDNIFY